MAEYIEREALIRRIKEIHCSECDSYDGLRCRACWVDDTLDYIDSEPAADVAPLVRCRDCEYSNKALYGWLWCTAGPCEGKVVLEDFYCKCGERKEGADND